MLEIKPKILCSSSSYFTLFGNIVVEEASLSKGGKKYNEAMPFWAVWVLIDSHLTPNHMEFARAIEPVAVHRR